MFESHALFSISFTVHNFRVSLSSQLTNLLLGGAINLGIWLSLTVDIA